MIRAVALRVCLLVAGAVPALAQTHPSSHPQGYPHGAGHMAVDSATHAALHALLHGSWTGTLTSAQGVSTGIDMSVARDSTGQGRVTMTTARPSRSGAASDFLMDGDKLQWTQDLSGATCKATAVVATSGPSARETITGKMACDAEESTFTLHKLTR